MIPRGYGGLPQFEIDLFRISIKIIKTILIFLKTYIKKNKYLYCV
jgi:hypothetical protein